MTSAAAQARQVPRVTAAALDAGHEPQVVHEGRRFRLVCSCGFRTPANATRKVAYLAIGQHVHEVGHQALADAGTPAPGWQGARYDRDTPEPSRSLPHGAARLA